MSEYEMIMDCYKKLLLNKSYHKVLLEIPFLSRSIDMVLIDDEKRVITIEFKLHDWNHAIQQAKDHLLGSDKAYICMPKRQLTSGLLDKLNKSGIGLYFYNPETSNPLEEIVSPQKTNNSWGMWKISLKRAINNAAHEEIYQIIPSSNAALSPL